MRKIAVTLLGIVFLSSFLAFVFWGILKLQQWSGKKPVPAQESAAKPTPEETMATPPTAPAATEVQVVFQLDSQKIEAGKVPVQEGASSESGQAPVVVDSTAARAMVDRLPELPARQDLKAAILETDRKGTPRKIVRGVPGEIIDRERTLSQLLAEHALDRKSPVIKISIQKKENNALETFASLSSKLGFKECLAEAETLHKDHLDDDGRNVNLRLASEKLDGLILQPGEEFGFNRIVGPRTKKAGYCTAGVISNGKVIQGLGGGICQVSTTLYRAALLCNMKILERSNHSIYEGIGYAQRGLDAAVSWGTKDFRFVNSLPIPVLLAIRSGRGYVKAAIFAAHRPFEKVELVTRNEVALPFQTQIRKNPKLKAGETRVIQPGVTGYRVEAYRKVTIKGVSREEPLSRDHYLTFPRIEEARN